MIIPRQLIFGTTVENILAKNTDSMQMTHNK